MASPQKLPRKGILKTSSSFDKADHHSRQKETKWDEMNIIATLHPPDKDYGHMKIDEPPTPYNKYSDPEDEDESNEKAGERRGSHGGDMLDPEALDSRLRGLDETDKPRIRRVSTTESSDEDEEETEELKAKRMMFEQKRKLHYNEFQAVRLAQNLMEDDDEEDVAEEEKYADADDDDDEENKNYQDVETVHNTLLNARVTSPKSGSEENITKHQVQLSPGETLIE
ncbi:hypothetical protein CHS0354_005066 [Potamilus streckersoni]|uniref:Protein phosphatase inhibitor 2 n=1 Tax=Potamilus streckersoni TaxID=2493646 RepID=A0AAE0SI33_9BIVA|nr:hypothetical protein CHS0354_005066 [Potamilus streckersoni]